RGTKRFKSDTEGRFIYHCHDIDAGLEDRNPPNSRCRQNPKPDSPVSGRRLRIELSAVTNKPTVVNLTQHAYFNLDGSPNILDHEVTLFADFYTPADADLIPTGEIRSVAGTPYDFRVARPVRNASGATYDTNYVAALRPGADGL